MSTTAVPGTSTKHRLSRRDWRTIIVMLVAAFVVILNETIVSRKAAESHWTVLALTFSSTISEGRATFMIVSLRITTKARLGKSMCGAPITMAMCHA